MVSSVSSDDSKCGVYFEQCSSCRSQQKLADCDASQLSLLNLEQQHLGVVTMIHRDPSTAINGHAVTFAQ